MGDRCSEKERAGCNPFDVPGAELRGPPDSRSREDHIWTTASAEAVTIQFKVGSTAKWVTGCRCAALVDTIRPVASYFVVSAKVCKSRILNRKRTSHNVILPASIPMTNIPVSSSSSPPKVARLLIRSLKGIRASRFPFSLLYT